MTPADKRKVNDGTPCFRTYFHNHGYLRGGGKRKRKEKTDKKKKKKREKKPPKLNGQRTIPAPAEAVPAEDMGIERTHTRVL